MKTYGIGQVCDRGTIGRRQERTTKRATDAQLWVNNPIIPIYDAKQGKVVIPNG
jgi:hypothetical protein